MAMKPLTGENHSGDFLKAYLVVTATGSGMRTPVNWTPVNWTPTSFAHAPLPPCK
jgi:hypothetical protein